MMIQALIIIFILLNTITSNIYGLITTCPHVFSNQRFDTNGGLNPFYDLRQTNRKLLTFNLKKCILSKKNIFIFFWYLVVFY